jgi:RNA ligase
MNTQAPFLGESPLQGALRSGQLTLENIQERTGVKWKVHPDNPDLVLFSYDQVASKKMDPVAQAARGHILNRTDWSHACRPMDRFFGDGEGIAGVTPAPNLQKSTFLLKEDGTLCSLYYNRGLWYVATRNSPAGEGPVARGSNETFAELFWKTFRTAGYSLPQRVNCTYIWELCSPTNQVLVEQKEPRLVLLAVRENESGIEFAPSAFPEYKAVVPVAANMEELRALFMRSSAIHVEGAVATEYLPDGRVLRSKVKHPAYEALAHITQGNLEHKLLEVKRFGDSGVFLEAFPQYTEMFQSISARFDALVLGLEQAWERVKDIPDQKVFAQELKGIPMGNVLFMVRKTGVPIREQLARGSVESLHKALRGVQ